MHLVPVRASVTKLSTAYPKVQGKVKTGSARPRERWEIPPFFEKLLKIFEFFKSVVYTFGSCNSERHQTFHGIPLGPGEGREGVGATEGGWVKFYPGHEKLQFSPIFQKFREFATILRLPTFYCHLFTLSVSVGYGSGHLSM